MATGFDKTSDHLQKLSEVAKLALHIVGSLVPTPDQVKIMEITGATSTIIEVKAAQGETAYIIGKKGGIAEAIRKILIAAEYAQGTDRYVVFKILNDDEQHTPRSA